MSGYLIRSDLTVLADAPPGTTVLDWAPGKTASSIDCGTPFFRGWRPTRAAADLFVVAAAAYCADKITSRAASVDAWTRDIEIRLPVADPDLYDGGELARALNFLTGDRWAVTPRSEPADPLAVLPTLQPALLPVVDVDAVSLFSGGLDSLCGVIDLLEGHPDLRLGLVGHHDGGQASSKQAVLFRRLAERYGAHRVVLRQLWLRPAPALPTQPNPSPPPVETTIRGRSLLFISAALALASSVGPTAPVYVPENGYIALNVPLTRARSGSASTRTTHPHFFHLLAEATTAANVPNPIVNPYTHMTKGEMLRDSLNQDLLRELAPLTVSCSHPEAARMQQRKQGNCGYCFPCLIRRSSLAVVGWDDENPPWDVLTDDDLITNLESQRGADLRAVLNGVAGGRPDSDVLRNAPLPRGTHADYLQVWRRGNAELRSWLEAGATGELARIVGRLP